MNIHRALGILAVAFLLTTAVSGRSEEPSASSVPPQAPADTGGMKSGGMRMGGRGMGMAGGSMSTMGMPMPMMGMMGGCPMMMEMGEKLEVEKIEKGVRLTFTSDDPKVASRIQKRAEIMRLMRELREGE